MAVYTDVVFNSGEDYSNLAGPDASIANMPAQLLPSDANMGAVSAEVGTGMQDAMTGLDSDGSSQFNDSQDDRQFTHPDSMEGIAGSPETEVLQNEQMYSSQESLPFSPLPESASPLIEPEGN